MLAGEADLDKEMAAQLGTYWDRARALMDISGSPENHQAQACAGATPPAAGAE